MLLAVGIIAASAFIQNHECWSQVCTTEQGQHDQNLIESIPCQLRNTEDSLQKRSARTQELDEQSRREGWKTRVGWKCLHFPYELEIDTQVQFVQLLYNYDPLFYL